MESDTSGYPSGYASPNLEKGMSEEQLKQLLGRLISSSEDLNVRVWLDGVYTDVESTPVPGDWMNGREVYFKVEGRVDRLKNGTAQ